MQVRQIQVHRTVARHQIQVQVDPHAMGTRTNCDPVIRLSPNENLPQRNVSTPRYKRNGIVYRIFYSFEIFSDSIIMIAADVAAKKRSSPSASSKIAADSTTNHSSKSASSSASNSKKSTRREELLKQLKAVEDAIARKRSKLS